MSIELQTKLINCATKYLETPWQHNQNSEYGIDCLRFWQKIAVEVGIELEDIPDSYGRNEPIEKIINYLDRQFKRVTSVKPSDLVLFNYSGSPHLGMIYSIDLDNREGVKFIHASVKAKKVTLNRLSGSYFKRWVYTYRIT